MNLKNKELWDSLVEKNTDPYGAAAIRVAEEALNMLDELPDKIY